MSSISGAGGTSYSQAGLGTLKQYLFKRIDSDGNGAITQSELEKAVTANGGTKQSADQLYAALDPKQTGSVSEQQFDQNLPGTLLNKEISSALLHEQEKGQDPLQQATDLTAQYPQLAAKGITVKQGPISDDQRNTFERVSNANKNDGGADALFSLVDPSSAGGGSSSDAAAQSTQLGSLLQSLLA